MQPNAMCVHICATCRGSQNRTATCDESAAAAGKKAWTLVGCFFAMLPKDLREDLVNQQPDCMHPET